MIRQQWLVKRCFLFVSIFHAFTLMPSVYPYVIGGLHCCMVYISWALTYYNQSRDSESESKVFGWGKHSRLQIKPGQCCGAVIPLSYTITIISLLYRCHIHPCLPCLPTISILKPLLKNNTHTHTRKTHTLFATKKTLLRCPNRPSALFFKASLWRSTVFLVKVQTNL